MTIVLIAEEIESTLHDVLQRIRESFDSKCVLKDDSTTNLVTIEPSAGQNAIVVDTLYGQTRGIVVAWQMLSCQTNNSSTQFFDIVTREAVPWFRRQWGTCVNFQTNNVITLGWIRVRWITMQRLPCHTWPHTLPEQMRSLSWL
eukprot:PhF_6_TR6033/c0_g2_i1/m.8705